MAEEEKRVPNYNPEEDDKEYIGTKLLDDLKALYITDINWEVLCL